MSWNEVLERLREVLATELVVLSGTPITLGTLCVLLVMTVATFALAALLRRGAERVLRRRMQDEGAVSLSGRLVHYLVLVLGLATVIHTSGVNLSAFFAAGAVFAVAIGFAMQNITQNFVSGIILLMERSIKPGDVIEVEGQFVRVIDMGIRVMLARTLDDEDLVIPNSLVAGNTVKNFTLRDSIYRVRVLVGVEYGSDLKLVRERLEATVLALPWTSKTKAPIVLLHDFGASSVDFEVSVWIDDPWQARRSASNLREAIWWTFKESGITIAFPQMDVHFDEDFTAAVRRPAPEVV